MSDTKSFIRTVYLYLFSLVGLFILVFGSIGLIKLGLTTWIFPDADDYSYERKPIMIDEARDEGLIAGLENCEETCDLDADEKKVLSAWLADYAEWQGEGVDPKIELKRRRQRQASDNLAMIIVGLPLYLVHWGIIKRDAKKKKA